MFGGPDEEDMSGMPHYMLLGASHSAAAPGVCVLLLQVPFRTCLSGNVGRGTRR